jgi:hypothetical protein
MDKESKLIFEEYTGSIGRPHEADAGRSRYNSLEDVAYEIIEYLGPDCVEALGVIDKTLYAIKGATREKNRVPGDQHGQDADMTKHLGAWANEARGLANKAEDPEQLKKYFSTVMFPQLSDHAERGKRTGSNKILDTALGSMIDVVHGLIGMGEMERQRIIDTVD